MLAPGRKPFEELDVKPRSQLANGNFGHQVCSVQDEQLPQEQQVQVCYITCVFTYMDFTIVEHNDEEFGL